MATTNMQMQTFVSERPVAFTANQRDELRDLHDVAGALGAQPGMKQQTFVANCLTPWDTQQERIFVPEGTAPTLAGADGGGGRNPAGLLFTAGVVSKGNGDCFLTPEAHTSLTKGGGQAGQGYPCVLTAGFCAGAAPTAGGIGYQEEISPTLKAAESGTNMVPSVLCLNDQGGRQMHCTEDMVGTLRAQEHGHQPLVMATQQGGAEIGEGVCPAITAAAGMSGNNQPVLFENHGIDSRYTGPHEVSPTMSARYGTGGNNVPLVTAFSLDSKDSNSMKSANPHSGCRETEVARTIDTWNPDPSKNQGGIAILQPQPYCIAGNIIDREVKNGGNGFGYQPDISYTLNTVDRHAIFSGNPLLGYQPSEVAGTELANQHKCYNNLISKKVFGQVNYGSYDERCTPLAASGGTLGGGGENLVLEPDAKTERVFSRQRSDEFQPNEVVSTQSARQHKDATDLVCQPYQDTVGTLTKSDHHGIGNQYVDDKCVVERRNLIRRLTPLECERLQGFPDYWTDVPGASDSARYKALGNSVAIPCVDFVLRGIAAVLRAARESM